MLVCRLYTSYRPLGGFNPKANRDLMNETLLVALVFAALLAIEWRYRLRSVRLGTAFVALAIWLVTQPNATRAARRALDTTPAERVTQIAGQPLTEYVAGVRTMEQAAADDAMMFVNERWMSVGVLFWLACSPVFRRARPPSVKEGTDVRAKEQVGR